MCGISGIISLLENISYTEYLEQLLELQEKRGPDAKGIHQYKNCIIGHNRLAIVDKNIRSLQPFVYKNLVISFNGEIYNYKEIKSLLNNEYNVEFTTESDTEVLIKLIYYKGLEEALKILVGMFSIALLDKKQDKLFLIRDRFGEKPCYYYIDNEKIIFASMPSPIAKVLNKNENKLFNINYECLNHYLFSGTFNPSNSMFDKIFQLECSHLLEIDINTLNIKKKRWWISNFSASTLPIEEYIEKAIIYCNNIDRDGMVLFSGGNDSGTISLFIENYEFLTLENGEEIYAENFLKETPNKLKKNKIISKEFIKSKSSLINEKHRSIINFSGIFTRSSYPVIITTMYLEQYFPDVKIILTGNGADELFYGYPEISLTSNIDKQLNQLFGFHNYWKPIDKNLGKIRDEFLDNFESSVINNITGYKNLKKCNIPRWLELHTYLLGDLNVDSDIIFMHSSIEARNPYLNHNLVDKCLSMEPSEFFYTDNMFETDNEYLKFTNMSKKPIKELLIKNGISKENIFRPKHGFGMESDSNMFNEINKNLVESFLNRKIIELIPTGDYTYIYGLIAPLELFLQEFEYLLDI